MPNDDAKAHPDISVTDELDPADVAVITDGLRAYDLSQTGYYDFRPLDVFVRDPQTGKVVGGLHGRSEFGLVYVAWFFLPEDFRRARIGSRVLGERAKIVVPDLVQIIGTEAIGDHRDVGGIKHIGHCDGLTWPRPSAYSPPIALARWRGLTRPPASFR